MRISRQVKIGLACGAAMCLSTVAAPPPALDRVPDNAAIAFVMPSVQSFVSDMRGFVNWVVPEAERADAAQGLDMFEGFLNIPGVNAAGSAAAVMYVNEDESFDGPPVVMLLPVSDFAQVREALSGQGAGPVYEAEINGESVFMKDVGGGFAAVGMIPELVQEFTGDAGHLPGHVQRLGSQGQSALEANDITMIANLEALAPVIRMAGEQMKQQMGMVMMMMGPQATQVQPMLEMVSGMMTRMADDGRSAVLGAQVAEAGISFDAGVQFKDGTDSFAMFSEKGSASGLLNRLPSSDFMFAYALDTAHPGVARLVEQMVRMSEAAGGGLGGLSFTDMMKNAKGMAGAMGSVPMMGAGLFSNFVTVTVTDDPGKTIGVMESAMKQINGKSMEGLKYATEWQSGATEIGGTSVSSYSMRMMPDGSEQGLQIAAAAMVFPMLFGPAGGPSGYMAAVDGAVVQTMSQNTPLMEKAIKAAREAKGLGTSESVAKVGRQLPPGRVFELYFSVDQMMNTVGPMAAMMGAMPGFEKVDRLTPIGIGTATGQGGMLSRLYLPGDVITWAMDFSQKMQGDAFGDEPAEEGGRPRF